MVVEKRPAKPPRTAATGRPNRQIPIISTTSETDPKPGQALLSPPTIGQLFTTFAAISLSGFGVGAADFGRAAALAHGGSVQRDVRAVLVPARRQHRQFLRDLRHAHAWPARRAGGARGLLGPPMILVMIVGAVYAHYGDVPVLHRMLTGVAVAAAGLMLAAVAKMVRPLFKNRAVAGPAI